MSVVTAVSDLPVFGAGTPTTSTVQPTDKDTFLKLLVAQMKYQDPMNPMEGTEFASQLAQFSSVEALQNINSKMDTQTQGNQLLAQSVNNTLATTLIGKNVRASDDKVTFDGVTPVDVKFNLNTMASPLTIDIVDANGGAMRTLTLPNSAAGDGSVKWDGRDGRGNLLPPGEYTVKISGKAAGGGQLVATPLAEGRIDGITFENGQPVLLMGKKRISFGAVLEIKDGSTDQATLLDRLLRLSD